MHSPPPSHLAVDLKSPSKLELQFRELTAKQENTVELLHLWKNEAHTYRLLAEAVATGRYTQAQARRALAAATFGPELHHLAFLPLSKEEHKAFTAITAFAQLPPPQFLWACLDTIMTNSDDEDLVAGCREAAHKRFIQEQLPGWA